MNGARINRIPIISATRMAYLLWFVDFSKNNIPASTKSCKTPRDINKAAKVESLDVAVNAAVKSVERAAIHRSGPKENRFI